jgi:hypothetical protein
VDGVCILAVLGLLDARSRDGSSKVFLRTGLLDVIIHVTIDINSSPIERAHICKAPCVSDGREIDVSGSLMFEEIFEAIIVISIL